MINHVQLIVHCGSASVSIKKCCEVDYKKVFQRYLNLFHVTEHQVSYSWGCISF